VEGKATRRRARVGLIEHYKINPEALEFPRHRSQVRTLRASRSSLVMAIVELSASGIGQEAVKGGAAIAGTADPRVHKFPGDLEAAGLGVLAQGEELRMLSWKR
jgi:hypothetical protein